MPTVIVVALTVDLDDAAEACGQLGADELAARLGGDGRPWQTARPDRLPR